MSSRTTSAAPIGVRRLGGALGAEVTGVDLSQPLGDNLFAAIKQAFLEHLVVVFPEQDLSPAAQVAFTARLGPVEAHPLGTRPAVEGQPEVLILENKAGKRGLRNDFWHSDITYAERPPLGSALYALTVTEGLGDTMFCNMYAAYEELSAGMRHMLDGLAALHSGARLIERNTAAGVGDQLATTESPEVAHPAVRTHPDTGRKALYINPYYTTRFADMDEDESQPLIDFLSARATRPENVYRHHWRPRDVVLWDNRCTMHYAVYDYDDTQPRKMHRTTAAGNRPV